MLDVKEREISYFKTIYRKPRCAKSIVHVLWILWRICCQFSCGNHLAQTILKNCSVYICVCYCVKQQTRWMLFFTATVNEDFSNIDSFVYAASSTVYRQYQWLHAQRLKPL